MLKQQIQEDTKSTYIRYKLNQSQHLSGKGSCRSQPKSGNDTVFTVEPKGKYRIGKVYAIRPFIDQLLT